MELGATTHLKFTPRNLLSLSRFIRNQFESEEGLNQFGLSNWVSHIRFRLSAPLRLLSSHFPSLVIDLLFSPLSFPIISRDFSENVLSPRS